MRTWRQCRSLSRPSMVSVRVTWRVKL
jgi:hypothetical protein